MATEISNSDDVINSHDVIARIEELNDQLTDRWIAGWNMPGYMPDSEPAEFDCFDDAKEYIAEEIERLADEMDERNDEELAHTLRQDVETLRKMEEGDFGATLCDYHYWITQDGQMGLDEDEQEELKVLEELAEECESYSSDWQYGETLIRDDYFTQYIEELINDCYEMPEGLNSGKWPFNHMKMDYEAAAEEAKQDYTSVSFDGVDYWIRAA